MSATENELGALHRIVAKYLKDKIEGEECTASDVANALKMLKDNNITCTPSASNHLGELQAALDKKQSTAPVDRADLEAALEQVDFSNARSN